MASESLPVDELREVLAGPHGERVIQLMVGRRFDARDVPPAAEAPAVVEAAEGAGLIDGEQLTPLGETLSHPLRELLQWQERGETIAFSDEVSALAPERFEGADVLEVGSGFGVNLLTLQEHAAHTTGVEYNPAYVEVALRRWREETGQEPLRLADSKTLAELEADR